MTLAPAIPGESGAPALSRSAGLDARKILQWWNVDAQAASEGGSGRRWPALRLRRVTEAGTPAARHNSSAWRDLMELARLVPGFRQRAALLIAMGVGAAIAETIGIGLAILFLYAMLGTPVAATDLPGPIAWLLGDLATGGFSTAGLAALLALLIALSALLIYAHAVISADFANRVAEQLRNRVHDVFIRVGYPWMQGQDQGKLIHTLGTETWLAAEAMDGLARLVVNLCAILVFGAALLLLAWQVAAIAALAVLATLLILRLLLRPVRRLGAETLAENQHLSDRMLLSLHGMRTIRAFAEEPHVLAAFEQSSARVTRLAVRTERVKALNLPIGEMGNLGGLVLIAAAAGLLGIAIPTVVACALLLFRMQPHLRGIEANRLALAQASPMLANLRETIAHEGKAWPTPGTEPFPGLAREIRFEAVTFRHEDQPEPSIRTASFTIPAGRTTAFVGPSGSGKSTLINLLLRLYEPDEGRVMVDGHDLLSFTRRSWLERLAIAGQDVELVEGTVEQNIRIARHEASHEAVRAACAATEILADIERLPDGFASRIGPRGISFSGGQRQRIGLARALLREPEILILDEAMSALEPELETRIRQRIETLMAGRTIILVSHQPTSIAGADHIVRIVEGRVLDTEGQRTVAS